MNEVASLLLKVLIAVIFALITRYLIPYLKTLRDDARWSRLIDMVKVAVEAAEQTIHEDGTVKKEEVTKFVTEWLKSYGINVTPEEIDKLIESAVYAMNLEKKKDAPNTVVNI